jgi:hypothetical protein
LNMVLVLVVIVRTRTTESKLSSHGREGSRHLEDFLALLTLLLLEPSAVVSEFLEFRKGGGNPDTVNVEEDALVHGVDEAVSIIFVHLDKAAAVVVTAGLDVRACVEDVNARTFDEKIGKHLDAGEREVEGKLCDEDITDALAVVLREGLNGTRPSSDVFANTVTRFTAHDGGFSNDVEEEIGNILEEMLHGANRGTRSFNILLFLLFLGVVVVVQRNHHLVVEMMFFSIRARRGGILLKSFLGTRSGRGKGRSGIVIVIVLVVDLLFSLSTIGGSFRV